MERDQRLNEQRDGIGKGRISKTGPRILNEQAKLPVAHAEIHHGKSGTELPFSLPESFLIGGCRDHNNRSESEAPKAGEVGKEKVQKLRVSNTCFVVRDFRRRLDESAHSNELLEGKRLGASEGNYGTNEKRVGDAACVVNCAVIRIFELQLQKRRSKVSGHLSERFIVGDAERIC